MPDSNTRQLPQQSEAMNHISKYLGVENVKQEKWWHVNKQVRISLLLKIPFKFANCSYDNTQIFTLEIGQTYK